MPSARSATAHPCRATAGCSPRCRPPRFGRAERRTLMYGWRGRIGLLVPSINTTMETELWRLAPEGVSVHTARIAGGRHGTPEELRSMEEESKHAAGRVANAEPDVVLYACTSGSFFEGPEWNRKICDQLSAITAAPTVTTAGAMAEALLANGCRRVDVVTPYV